ncbi:MAG TPA: glycosyltransferase family 2 protein [Xanthobacteraceae bacterium]|nr:glycosyltransferase family 2 protein [Xanthobacteraceae bacterium]
MPNLVSVVVTFRNEEEVLPVLVERVSKVFADIDYDFELLLIDDSSTDKSATIFAEMHKRDPRVKGVTTSRRFGVYVCMLGGLRLASGDCAIYLDCDLQDPPELIPKMLDAWRGGADIVNMRRTRRLGESWFHVFVVKFAYRVIHLSSAVEIPIDVGDFKLYSRRALDHLCAMGESYPYIRGLAAWIGFNQSILEYERLPRLAGESKRGGISKAALRVFSNAILSFSGAPIYAVGLLGIAGLIVSISGLIATLALNADWRETALATSGLILSVILLSNFVLGLYIYRIWQEVLQRPTFIIKDRLL